jgi:TolB-like protein/Tfp pilus assembly protein PilF
VSVGGKKWTAFLIAFATIVTISTVLFTFNVAGLQERLLGTHRRLRSLAVLPLQNLTSDSSKDYFADGLTEDLTTQLSKLADLTVISHTSVMQYKGTHKPLPQIANELHVDAVVEGAVEFAGERVRITAQLVDANTDRHIWADTYDRELSNVLLLQSEVASDVAKQIDLQLTPQQRKLLFEQVHPVVPGAYQAYLLGRIYWNKRTSDGLAKAGEYFQQAIEKDPNYALAYSGLADYFAFLSLIGGPEIMAPKEAMAKAKAAALKSVELDPSSAEAHASLGHVLANYDWDWAGAEREFRRAIVLNPNYANAHHWYAHYLMQLGRRDESLNEAKRALALDPYSPFVNNGLARQYYLSRQYDQALAQCQLALQIEPNYLPARILLGLAYKQKGMQAEAISELEQARNAAPALPMAHALLANVYATAGHLTEAHGELELLKNMAQSRYVPASYFAVVSIALGDKDAAFSFLNKSYDDRSEHMLYLGVEPLVDPLRSDPRFDTLMARVGLKHSIAVRTQPCSAPRCRFLLCKRVLLRSSESNALQITTPEVSGLRGLRWMESGQLCIRCGACHHPPGPPRGLRQNL